MATERLNLEPEVQEVLKCIDEQNNFLLSGGAGSGKTYSLVQVIRQVLHENPKANIACITYTNAAVREIKNRVNHDNLAVSTIHDFLWDNIKHFQKDLKNSLIELINNPDVQQLKLADSENAPKGFFDHLENGIQYKEYLRINEGIVSHDEVLIIANHMFAHYSRLCDILKDKYRFIFLDEYQDTNRNVIEILLESLQKGNKVTTVGFFGDAMQAIYDDGIGDLTDYINAEHGRVIEIQKKMNRRNPRKIIELANRLRTDGLIQEPSMDMNAPNMVNGCIKEGSVKFLYSDNSDFSLVKRYLSKMGWDFTSVLETKELNLTHNLIAEKAGFANLMAIYDKDKILDYKDRIKKYIKANEIKDDFSHRTFGEVIEILGAGKSGAELKKVKPTPQMQAFIDSNPGLYEMALNTNYLTFSKIYVEKEQLIDDRKQNEYDETGRGSKLDNLIKHLYKIQSIVSTYQLNRFNEFLRRTDYLKELTSIEQKRILKERISKLSHVGDKTIEEVVNEANEMHLCMIDDKYDEFRKTKQYVFDRVKSVKFKEFQNLFEYLEGKTPFSTQHKTKGSEYKNVLVILDNGNWNNYNFECLFTQQGTETVIRRTRKIFYVCCTRSMENLAIFYHNPNSSVIAKATEWFGSENIYKID